MTMASAVGSAPPHSDVPGPARHDLQPVLVAVLKDLRNVFGRARQHDGQRHLAISGERVGLERATALLLGDDAIGADQRLEVLDDGAAPVEHGPVGVPASSTASCNSPAREFQVDG